MTSDNVRKMIRKFVSQRPRNTAEMLYHGGGIHVQKSQSGGGSPLIRGFEANRVLLVIDGVRMNNAIYRSGHVHNAISIDANSLDRTEVIFGPSSVGYGSDALGGVIHFYTKTPRLNKDEFFDYTKSISYNLKDQSKINNYSLELSTKNLASYTSYTKSDFGDIHMGKVRNHGYNNWGLVNYYSENIEGKFFENQSLINLKKKGKIGGQLDIYNFKKNYLLKKNISGIDQLLGGKLELVVDRSALLVGESIGFIFLLYFSSIKTNLLLCIW